MVKSNKLFDPQTYLELVTGKCYFLKSDVITFMEDIIYLNHLGLWNYPLSEIDHIVENNLNVVLVDCSHYEGEMYINEYRWFEVPEDFCEEDENEES